jgi:type I restriction enzyme, S subunit
MSKKWPTKKLGEIAVYKNGRAFKKTEWSNKGLPIIRIQNLNNKNARFNYYEGDYDNDIFVSRDDILISWSASLDIYLWGEEPGLLNQHIYKVELNENLVDKSYFFYAYKSVLEEMRSKMHGGAMKHVTKKKFISIEIILPPLEEQKRIVKALEEKLVKVKEAIQLRQDTIASTEKILTTKISEILNDLNISEIELGSIGKMVSGGTPKRSNKEYWNGEIAWTSSGELESIYIDTTNEMITKVGLKNSNAKIVPKGSLLIGMYDTAALKMSIAKKDISTNQAIISLLPGENFISEFVYYQLLFLRPQVLKLRQGVRQQNLNASKIKAIKIKLPDLKNQEEITKELDELSERVAELHILQKNQLVDLKSLERAYLHESLTGELT